MKFFKFKKKLLSVQVLIEPDSESFHAYCPALKGLHIDGKTEKEAAKHALEAVKVYLASLIKHHDPLPPDLSVKVEHVPSPAKKNQRTKNPSRKKRQKENANLG
jgi:predicted RNase H-like HicB family nuclease